jgi:hypothetical protein
MGFLLGAISGFPFYLLYLSGFKNLTGIKGCHSNPG